MQPADPNDVAGPESDRKATDFLLKSPLSPVNKVLILLDEVITGNRDFLRIRNSAWKEAQLVQETMDASRQKTRDRLETDFGFTYGVAKAAIEFGRAVSRSGIAAAISMSADDPLPGVIAHRVRGMGWDPDSFRDRQWMETSLHRARKEGWLHAHEFADLLGREMGLSQTHDPNWQVAAAHGRYQHTVGWMIDRVHKVDPQLAAVDKKIARALHDEVAARRATALARLEQMQEVILTNDGVPQARHEETRRLYSKLERPGVMFSCRLLGPVYGAAEQVRKEWSARQRGPQNTSPETAVALQQAVVFRDQVNFIRDIHTQLTDAVSQGREDLFPSQARLNTPVSLASAWQPLMDRGNPSTLRTSTSVKIM